jgi:hypothetical protein
VELQTSTEAIPSFPVVFRKRPRNGEMNNDVNARRDALVARVFAEEHACATTENG